jgi:hypothetical protein
MSEIKLDERWKHQLTKGQIRVIEKVAGRVGKRYGYFSGAERP